MALSERDALVVEVLTDMRDNCTGRLCGLPDNSPLYDRMKRTRDLLQSFITDFEAKAPAVDLRKWARHDDGCALMPRYESGPGWIGQVMAPNDAVCTCGLDASLGNVTDTYDKEF